jgi:hypothetical protein
VTVSSLPPEHALLLDAIAPLDQARADRQAWDGGRWGRTLRIADWHRLSPTLYCHLESKEEHAPAAVLSALERAYLAAAARSLFLAAARRQVVDALAAADVPAMLLKGAALVETVYSDPAQREMLDLDVLVPADRLPAANAALAALGYRTLPADDDPEGARSHVHAAEHHDPALVGEQHVVAVELHHHVVIAGEGAGFDIDDAWQRARAAPGATHLLPAPADLLLHVCLHFTRNRLGGSYRRRHTGGALGQICDIARIVEHEPIDWDALAAAARSYRLDARVFLALFAARELGVPVPSSALADLQPPRFDPRVGRRLVSLRVLRTGEGLPVRTVRWMLAPSREVLSRGWEADPSATLSLARAYLRRARAHAPGARSALRRPWSVVQDRRLNGQIHALEERA